MTLVGYEAEGTMCKPIQIHSSLAVVTDASIGSMEKSRCSNADRKCRIDADMIGACIQNAAESGISNEQYEQYAQMRMPRGIASAATRRVDLLSAR